MSFSVHSLVSHSLLQSSLSLWHFTVFNYLVLPIITRCYWFWDWYSSCSHHHIPILRGFRQRAARDGQPQCHVFLMDFISPLGLDKITITIILQLKLLLVGLQILLFFCMHGQLLYDILHRTLREF